jgi:antirestriction protein ArdC
MSKTHASESTRIDAYTRVTDLIIQSLESGVVPWTKPWRSRFGGALPQNLTSGKSYRGINLFLLGLAPFEDPRWLTYRQAQERGGHVRKGEKGMPIVFFKELELDADTARDGIAKKLPFLSLSTVFNVTQCEGLDAPSLPGFETGGTEFSPTVDASHVYDRMPSRPELQHGFTRACYAPKSDLVMMPRPDSFIESDGYYRVLFHELVHATGHQSRIGRPGFEDGQLAAFGDSVYSREELIAELGSAMIADASGVPLSLANSAAYIDGWLRALKADKRMIVSAASQAHKAADFILGVGA